MAISRLQTRAIFRRLLLSILLFLSIRVAVPAEAQFIRPTTSLPLARGFHGSAVLGDFLYVIGGSSPVADGDLLSVYAARINADGSLSKFVSTTPIPQSRHYIANSTVVMNDTVYVIGGSSAIKGGKRSATVIWNRPQANGMLGEWKESAPFPPAALSCLAAFSTPGYLHMTGGLSTDAATNKVWSMPISPDGSPTEWRPGPDLPAPLWFHCAAVVGGRAWVWGGQHKDNNENVASPEVYSAPILGSGTIGAWRQEEVSLPSSFYSAASAVAGPYLFSFSPRYSGAVASNDIWWTMVGPDGMKPWKRQPTEIPIKIYHACAADYRRGIIFVMGGKPESKGPPAALNFMVQLSPQARKLAEADWAASQNSGNSAAGNAAAEDSVSTVDLGKPKVAAGTDVSGAAPGAPAPPGGSLPGFLSLEEARNTSTMSHRPLVLYFHAPAARPCVEQATQLATPEGTKLLSSAVFGSVDVRQYPQQAQQYGVFIVPTWFFFDADGALRDRAVGVTKPDVLAGKLAPLQNP